MAISADWIELEKFPFPYWSRPLILANDEFIIVPQKYSSCKGDGIYQYRDKTWNKIIDYPSDFGSSCHSASIDDDNKVIYVDDDCSQLHQFDLAEKKFKSSTKLFEENCSEHPRIVYVNDVLHIIGGKDSNIHYIYHPDTKKVEKVHEFSEMALQDGFADHDIIYMKSINSILMFGGETDENYLDTIHQYSLIDKVWKKLDAKIPLGLCSFGLIA